MAHHFGAVFDCRTKIIPSTIVAIIVIVTMMMMMIRCLAGGMTIRKQSRK